jgi:hypothetical protein
MDVYKDLLEFYEGLKQYKELLNKLYYHAFESSGGRIPFNSPYDRDSAKREQITKEIDDKREYSFVALVG